MTALLLAALAWAHPVTGRVAEFGTGTPLADADLTWTGPEGQVVTARTGDHGRFAVDLAEGTWRVAVAAPEHAPLDAEVQVPTEPVEFFLEPRPPLVVVVEAFEDTPHVTSHTVDAEMALETPGTYDDSVRLVQSLPGVAIQREYSPSAGDLNIRGSANGDNRYYLDGIELPYLYHYNQYASVFPTTQIDTLELHSSTFGAPYGDAVGAVIDVESITEAPEVIRGSASVNFVMAGADVQAPLGDDGWWVSAAGRRSYQDLAGERTAQFTLWPVFQDFALRLGRDGATTDTQVFAWGAGDHYRRAAGELDLLDPVEAAEVQQFDYRRGFQVAGVAHRWKFDRARIVGAVVHDRLRGDLDGGGRQDLRTVYLTSRYDDTFRLGDTLDLLAGWELRGERTALEVATAGRTGILVAEEAPALARGVDVDAIRWRARTGLYGQLRWHPGAWTVMPGLRLASDSLGEPLLPEPRLAVRWRAGSQTALKAAAGLYHQAPETEHLIGGTGDPELPTTTSWQASVGWEQTFAERLELTVEAYGKLLDDVLFFPVDAPAEVIGRGRAWGVEATTRYRLLELFFLRGWIGVGRSEVAIDGRGWVPADGDQPLNAGVVASWDVTAAWNVAVRYRIGSGMPWTPVAQGLYDATTDQWVPVPGPENSERMPLFQRLDLHAAHTWAFRRWSLTLSGDLWLVPPSSAQLYPTWNYDYTEQGWVIGPAVLPVLGLRAVF